MPRSRIWKRWKVFFIVLFGATAGQAVVWYTGQFYALIFLQTILKVPADTAYKIVAIGLVFGTPFSVKASYIKKGPATPLAGVKVTDGRAVTDKHGAASVTVTRAGKLTLVATLKGYIRAEATVTVTK